MTAPSTAPAPRVHAICTTIRFVSVSVLRAGDRRVQAATSAATLGGLRRGGGPGEFRLLGLAEPRFE